MITTNPGIDYSGLGATCNRDPETGIRYGIIPAHRLAHWIWDEFESQYALGCPCCGSEHEEDNEDDYTECEDDFHKLICTHCEHEFSEDDHWSEEPIGHTYDRDGLQMRIDSDGVDCWVFKSPVTIRAQFCSPCAPGACYLSSPCPDGARAYAVPLDWFDDESPCPYADAIESV